MLFLSICSVHLGLLWQFPMYPLLMVSSFWPSKIILSSIVTFIRYHEKIIYTSIYMYIYTYIYIYIYIYMYVCMYVCMYIFIYIYIYIYICVCVCVCMYVCVYIYRIFARIGRTFLHRTEGYAKGVRPIHKARNLGCFTSSAQATPRSQIDDQPLPQPLSITARVWFDFNCVSYMFSTSLTVQLLFVISDLSSRFYFKHNNYNTLHECPSPYYNQRMMFVRIQC